MPTSYYNISLDHLADHLILLSSSSSFWFSLNSSCDNEFHISKRLRTSRPADCRIASLRPLVVPPSCPSPSITVALAIAPSIACRRCAVRRRRAAAAATPPPCCRRRRTVALPPPSHCRAATTAAATATAPPPSCRRRRAVALPPPPLTLPPPPHRRQATSRCLAAALPPPPRRRQAVADLALSRCRHRHCRCRRAAVRWLVVALLSVVRFRHCMPSCDHQHSCCRPLSPMNCLPPPPPATAAAAGPPGRHNRHRHHRGRTHRRKLAKKVR